MRRPIIDYVRHRDAQKRGGDVTFTSIENRMAPVQRGVDLEELGRALDELAALDAGLAELVDLKFFCGFSFAEIAAMRECLRPHGAARLGEGADAVARVAARRLT